MIEILKWFILPSKLIIVSLLIGFSLLSLKKAKRFQRFFFTCAALIYIIFGSGPLAFWLMENLEYRYRPIEDLESMDRISNIVILSGYAENDLNLPLSSMVNSSSAFRIIEAKRILTKFPKAEIIISGKGDVPKIMKKLLDSLGNKSENFKIDNQSNSTYESSLYISNLQLTKKFVLVTSAGHMPRAMGVLKKMGMDPIPAPTDYKSRKNYMAISYLPSPLHLHYSDLAVHEYLGILWYKLTNRL